MVTPIFDMSDSTEQADALKRLGVYPEFTLSDFNQSPYTDLQVLIDRASMDIYKYTKYYPKQTSQEMTVQIRNSIDYGRGRLPYKMLANVSNITTTDPNFDGITFDNNDIEVNNDGTVMLLKYTYDNYKNRLFPRYITITADYGFVKLTELPELFKDVCVDLIMFYIVTCDDYASLLLTEAREGKATQKYRNRKMVKDNILSQLKGIYIV